MQNIPFGQTFLIYFLFIWSVIWKGVALWKSAKQNQRIWFIAILVVNTFGLLDIVYLFLFSKKRMTLEDIKAWFMNTFFTSRKSE